MQPKLLGLTSRGLRSMTFNRDYAILLAAALVIGLLSGSELVDGATTVGINYGRVADNLPDPTTVAQFVALQGIGKVKIYDANTSVIQAFANTQVQLVIGLPNADLYNAATNTSFAYEWVRGNVSAFYPATQITGIAVGNEILTANIELAGNLLDAMNNIHSALVNLGLDSAVKVSSPHALNILQSSFPPSAGQFNQTYATTVLHPLLNFLVTTGSYVMVNVYPFFAYSSNPTDVPLNYALFQTTPAVVDPTTGLQYVNLFDAQLDAVYAAMTALDKNFINLTVTVTETGWPSAGDPNEMGASMQNAADYNGNLVSAMLSGKGTPLKPDVAIQAYIFALFNENDKPGPSSERNYGLFYPDMTPVYSLNFSSGNSSPESVPPTPSPGVDGNTTVNGTTAGNGTTTGNAQFCIAKSDASASSLQAALDYACGPGGADCVPLQPGQSCFDPDTLWAHASYAFNSFYQINQRQSGACFFGGNAYVDTTSPSTTNCTFPTQ